jgi:hypothetical protein
MKGTLQVNGWFYHGRIMLRPGLFSSHYRNRDGWFAREIFQGRSNRRLGILVYNEKGHAVGLVQHVGELP